MSHSPPDDPLSNLGPGKPSGAATGAGVALGGILVAIVAFVMCCGLPVLLLLPATGSAREAARRNGCLNNMRSLALALQCYESSQKHYPVASRGTTDLLKGQTVGGHGDAPAASDDGSSWLFCLLPGMEEEILHKEMRRKRQQDAAHTGPFDADFVNDAGQHYATSQIPSFRCPSYSGSTTTMVGDIDAAISNYCAIVGSDLSEGDDVFWKTTPNWENGGLPSACWSTPHSQTAALAHGTCLAKGIRLRDMPDGISKTMVACESREEVFNAWISGASMWVVAASPNSLASQGANVGRDAEGDNFIAVLQNGERISEDGVGLALNFGSDVASPPAKDVYLHANQWATARDRVWGPSSEHSGDIVIHVFADTHARAIPREVNPTVYLRFITRSEGDSASEDDIE